MRSSTSRNVGRLSPTGRQIAGTFTGSGARTTYARPGAGRRPATVVGHQARGRAARSSNRGLKIDRQKDRRQTSGEEAGVSFSPERHSDREALREPRRSHTIGPGLKDGSANCGGAWSIGTMDASLRERERRSGLRGPVGWTSSKVDSAEAKAVGPKRRASSRETGGSDGREMKPRGRLKVT